MAPQGKTCFPPKKLRTLQILLSPSWASKRFAFTGGEPLVRADLVEIISRIHQEHPEVPLSITTNGIGLDKRAAALAEAGLTRINVSLDTICRETFAELTRRDKLEAVLKGIDGAAEAGLWPIKINLPCSCPASTTGRLPRLLEWALKGGYQLRFIEQMPLDADNRWTREGTITAAEIREKLYRLRARFGTRSTRRFPRPTVGGLPLGTVLDEAGFPVDGTGIPGPRGHHRFGDRILLRRLHPHPPNGRRQDTFLPLLRYRD